MRVFIIHGIHTSQDVEWMDRLSSMFFDRGFSTRVWTYGYAYALLTRWQNPGRAKKLAALIQPGDIVVGHSNGCALAWLAAWDYKAKWGGAVLMNPALDCDRVMPPGVPWVNLYSNQHDLAVKVAAFFPKHPWGAQGKVGICLRDDRYLTRFTHDPGPMKASPIRGHSAIINEGLSSWGKVIVQDVLDRVGTR